MPSRTPEDFEARRIELIQEVNTLQLPGVDPQTAAELKGRLAQEIMTARWETYAPAAEQNDVDPLEVLRTTYETQARVLKAEYGLQDENLPAFPEPRPLFPQEDQPWIDLLVDDDTSAVAPLVDTPSDGTGSTTDSTTDMPDPRVTMPPPGEMPDGTPAPEPQNTGIVPPSLQDADGLTDDFDAMLEAEAGSMTTAADAALAEAPEVVTAPAAVTDAVTDDVLGDLQVADAVLEVPTPEMAQVGAVADPLGDVVMDSPATLVDDFDIEIPAEPAITFDEPEVEPAMADFDEPDIDEPSFDAVDDPADDPLGLGN